MTLAAKTMSWVRGLIRLRFSVALVETKDGQCDQGAYDGRQSDRSVSRQGEIIEPGVQRLMHSRTFTELREGKLSLRRLQVWRSGIICTTKRLSNLLRSASLTGFTANTPKTRRLLAASLSIKMFTRWGHRSGKVYELRKFVI